MNKLVAFAALGLGLVQAVVACSSDSGSTDGTGGTGGASAGSGGKGTGGSHAGSSSGGHSGVSGGATGGSSAGGGAGKGGTGAVTGGTGGTGGTGTGGSMAGAPAEGGAAGDMGGGQAGAAGAPPVEPVMATEYWLSQYCQARSKEVLGCDSSPEWAPCFDDNSPYLSTNATGICPKDDANPDTLPLTLAVISAFDTLATYCVSPMKSDMRCNPTTHAPEFIDQTCRDADTALKDAVTACN